MTSTIALGTYTESDNAPAREQWSDYTYVGITNVDSLKLFPQTSFLIHVRNL